jgi:site-specific DNA recombinase
MSFNLAGANMQHDISEDGSANAELQALVHSVWVETATSRSVDITGFDPHAALCDRLAWAKSHGFEIGGILSRFSSKLQHSTTAQVRDNVQFAASHNIYVAPEFVCVDEAVSGRKARRDGLARMTALLKAKMVRVLLVFKVSRLFRVAYLGFKFFQEEIVEEDLRAISISQGIDTADHKAWKQLAYLHGIMDEMLLGAIADHVRSGLGNLFQMGYVTGALTIGYVGVEVPGAPLTKLGRPRRMPAVCEETAKLIVEHFKFIRDGMPIKQGWKRWVAAAGPCDPRSSGRMSRGSYRRMLSNPRYTGCWAFGRKRNQWSTKRDYNRAVDQPETDVILVSSEELRIVPDELYLAVQQRLGELKLGPRGPKRRREPQLWDLVTDCFFCAECSDGTEPIRFYQAGARGHGMRCKHAELCPSLTVIRREEAVRAVCGKLTELLLRDGEMITAVIARARQIDSQGDEMLRGQVAELDKKIIAIGRKINDLTDLAGDGTDEDRADLKAKIRAAQLERTTKQAERAQVLASLKSGSTVITPDQVRIVLCDLTSLLVDGAAGKLGDDVVYRAAEVFRQLVGGRIFVHVHARPGRKLTTVEGRFEPQLLKTTEGRLESLCRSPATELEPVSVWLRKPPRVDALAPRVHELIDLENLSFRDAAKVLLAEGHKINSAVVYQIYSRYYQMIGQPMPKRRYNNGRPRRSKGDSAA